MKKLMILLLIPALILAWSTQSEAKIKKLGQAGMTFLQIIPEARLAGTGGAFNAVPGYASDLFSNPAGIGFLKSPRDVVLSRINWIADIKLNSVAAAWNVGEIGIIGVSFISMDYGDIYGTEILEGNPGYKETGNVDVSEYAFGLAYSKRFTDKFALGGQVKFASQKLSDSSVSGIGFDFGTFYFTGIKNSRLSMSIRNFSRSMYHANSDEKFGMPLTFKIGIASTLVGIIPGLAEGGPHSLDVSMEAQHPRDHPEKVNLGLEYSFSKMAFLRAGYAIGEDDRDISLGFGLQLSLGNFKGRVDYAYQNYGDVLGAVHGFSIGSSF